MTGRVLSRRRVLSILAVGATIPLIAAERAHAAMEPYTWRGVALGANADVTLYSADRAQAMLVLEACVEEIARLEAIFSLHRADSALSRLNRDGELADPPVELSELLSVALRLSARSAGRFDPTVQPLWRLMADHFAHANADHAGPDAGRLAAARALIDYRAVRLEDSRISLMRPGMQITLNGIAQGYVSDKVGALLSARRYRHALVNLGEILAIDRPPDGGAWRIGIPSPADRAHIIAEVELASGAVATSAARGLLFEVTGRFNHLIDPTRLHCADVDRSVTVVAPSCAMADGLSTLGALLPDPTRDFAPYLSHYGARAYVVPAIGAEGDWLGSLT